MSENEPKGHQTPFTGDAQILFHCVQDVISRVRTGDYISKQLHLHIAQAYGEAHALRPDDTAPTPVFAATSVPETADGICDALEAEIPVENEPKQFDPTKWWAIAQLLMQLAQLLGKKN